MYLPLRKNDSTDFLFLLKVVLLISKAFLGFSPRSLCKLSMRVYSAVPDRHLAFKSVKDVHVTAACSCLLQRSRIVESLQIQFHHSSSTSCLLKFFLYSGIFRTD